LNYTWYKNGVAQSKTIHELSVDDSTLFLARFNNNPNATYSRGDGNASFSDTNFMNGKINQAINMTSSTSRLNFSTSGNLNTSQGTIEFWISPNWAPATTGVIHFAFQVYTSSTHRMALAFYSSDDTLRFRYGGTSISADVSGWSENEWHHVAAVWASKDEGAGVISYHNLYIDGLLKATTTSNRQVNLPSTMAIGYRYSSATTPRPVNASFDEFRISDRERSADEIWSAYSDNVLRHEETLAGNNWVCSLIPTDSNGDAGYILNSEAAGVNDYSVTSDFFDYTSQNLNETLKAGKPTGLVVRVLAGGSPVVNATVEVTEENGYSTFAFEQLGATQVSNKQFAVAKTNANGIANFTIIATGGRTDSSIGLDQDYHIPLEVKVNSKSIFKENLLVLQSNRYPSQGQYVAAYTLGAIPNEDDISGVNVVYDNVYSVYSKIRYFLTGTGFG